VSTSHFSRFRVLVADDDAGCRDSIVSLLSGEGFDALAVGGGRAAIDLLEKQCLPSLSRREIHFLIVDYNMPDLTGLDVLQKIRRDLDLELPSILVTASFDLELVDRVRRLGGFAVLPKPLEPTDFRAMVWKLVRSRLSGGV